MMAASPSCGTGRRDSESFHWQIMMVLLRALQVALTCLALCQTANSKRDLGGPAGRPLRAKAAAATRDSHHLYHLQRHRHGVAFDSETGAHPHTQAELLVVPNLKLTDEVRRRRKLSVNQLGWLHELHRNLRMRLGQGDRAIHRWRMAVVHQALELHEVRGRS